MANVLSVGTGAASSADLPLSGGESLDLIHGVNAYIAPSAYVTVEKKGSNGFYTYLADLSRDNPGYVVSGPGTYRVSRGASSSAVGVDQNDPA